MSERFVAELRDMSRGAAQAHRSDAVWTAELAARVQRARRRRAVAMAGVSTALVAGVAVGLTTLDRGPAPVPPVGPGASATAVAGTAVCQIDSRGSRKVDGVLEKTMDVTCELRMSDPRVSGTDQITVVQRFLDPLVGATWTGEGILTTADGTWRGTATGVNDLQGNLPALQGMAPFDIGQVHYVGEGAYEGLEFSYFFAGSNAGLAPGYDAVGWIESTG